MCEFVLPFLVVCSMQPSLLLLLLLLLLFFIYNVIRGSICCNPRVRTSCAERELNMREDERDLVRARAFAE